jgi:hypothetical protein
MALGPTQHPIQWVPGALSLGVKQPGREADHSLPSSAKVKVSRTVPPLPNTPSWRGAQFYFSYLSSVCVCVKGKGKGKVVPVL